MRASSSKDIQILEKKINYRFKRTALIEQALTHKSFAKEQPGNSGDFNERLEFLGDAILELVISEYIYKSYPHYTEAELSKIKAYAVQERTLADASVNLDIGHYLRLGKGEETSGGRKKPSLLADAFEALIAAIYLDGGLKNTRIFILGNLEEKINTLVSRNLIFDFKTKFQEVVQEKFSILPKYRIKKEEGPEHMKTFEVEVFINTDLYGTGRGKSKKESEQKAAQAGLKKLQKMKILKS
jgi:ribonuclease-3